VSFRTDPHQENVEFEQTKADDFESAKRLSTGIVPIGGVII
jgi:hypothetical protein